MMLGGSMPLLTSNADSSSRARRPECERTQWLPQHACQIGSPFSSTTCSQTSAD